MGLIVFVVIVVVIIGGAVLMDHQDRKHGRRQRSAGDMLGRRRERELNVRSTPVSGVPVDKDWDKSLNDRLKDKNSGGM